jgi:branched-chain amino acid transport system substrate-binding protein
MRIRNVVAAFAVMALVLAACGGDNKSDNKSDSATGGTAAPAPTNSAIQVGLFCDRSGATQLIGVNHSPGFLDYIDYVNTQAGGVDGHPISVIDVDHGYQVPPAVANYQQMKDKGAVAIVCYGTPIAAALDQLVEKDKIPCLTPGFGIAQAGDPTKYPYQFPVAASYWSQAAAAMDYALDHAKGSKPKIAYLYYDNPAGKEPMAILDKLAAGGKFELQKFAVPAPGLDMAAQVTDITQRYKADFVVSHLFGRAPSVSIKAFKEAGYPLNQVISLVWGSAEADIEAAGGFAIAEGYTTIQFAGVGQDFKADKEITAMFKARNKTAPDALVKHSVYYNRGVFVAGMIVEGIRNALKSGSTVTGETMKAGLEQLKGFSLDGLAPPLTISATDHEGGGFTRIYQVKGGKLVAISGWTNPDHQVVLDLLKAQ